MKIDKKNLAGSHSEYADLHECLQNGNSDRIKKFLDGQPDVLSAKITPIGQTALDIAVVFGHEGIVKELAELASQQNLENQAIMVMRQL